MTFSVKATSAGRCTILVNATKPMSRSDRSV
jgi:hypothetical protein